MSESFTVQISSNLVKKLLDDGEKVKKRTRKPKPKPKQKIPQEPQAKPLSDDSKALKGPSTGWPVQPPIYLPPPPLSHRAPSPELDAIRSVLEESEKVVERLQKQEENMLQEVTQRAKDLHDKEFKLPNQRPMPCLDEKDACLKCYRDHINDPLRCAQFVKSFADCARSVRQQVGAATN